MMGEIIFDTDNFIIVQHLNEELLYAIDRSAYRSAFLETCTRLMDRNMPGLDAIEYPTVTATLLVEKDANKYELSAVSKEITYDMLKNVWTYN